MLLAILAIWFGYKRARNVGRNPYIWGAIGGAVFVGSQLVIEIAFATFIATGQVFWGWSEGIFERYEMFVAIPAILFSWFALQRVFRYLDKEPEVISDTGPPPPPTFDQGE